MCRRTHSPTRLDLQGATIKLIEKITTGPDWGDEYQSVTIEHYASDDDMTHKIKAFETLSGKTYKRAKTFTGETAWMDANRHYGDIFFQVKNG